jgi:hypothetical protein
MQLSDRHTTPTPALPPTCSVALYKAFPSPVPATDSLTPPELGAFMGETLDPANASKENIVDVVPRPDSIVAFKCICLPTPLVDFTCILLSEVHIVYIVDVIIEARAE